MPKGYSDSGTPWNKEDDVNAYLPTREEIEQGCLLIQSRWEPEEFYKRNHSGIGEYDEV